ncbi:phage tail sheath subtilisin-like domain-containing protein [Sodalis sp.]|uniref:phage tail sheath subtilisin-like domain-containing protein n=1 Tax=Sodalis sp. (in: enterobacteria) TaxID=1898979 RepID=UPI003873286E
MSANYLHGPETIEVERGPRPVRAVKSSVIGLIGTAPTGAVNQPIQCLSEKDAAQFGPEIDGFTIPQALRAIYDHGAGTVVVINVLEPTRHTQHVDENDLKFDVQHQRARLRYGYVSHLVLKSADSKTTYRRETDYRFEPVSGTLTRQAKGAIPAGEACIASYDHLDTGQVTAADILGSIDTAGRRSGIKVLDDVYNLLGYDAKILIAPVYCTQTSVTAELAAYADKLKAIAYVDAPIGTTFAQAIAGRGSAGTINFNTASERVRLCYPHALVYDKASNKNRLEPLSQRAAGLRAKVDLEKGFWWSSSNQEIAGIVGMERALSAKLGDAQSEVNQLNENGITTVFNGFGTGLRLWGNRTAAFPTVTHMKNFENVRRTGDMLDEALRFFSLQYLDRPINQALIDALCESVNAYGRKLIGDGAVLGFRCWYDKARNTQEELSAGHLLLNYAYTPPPPMERLTYETEITAEFLANLKGSAS